MGFTAGSGTKYGADSQILSRAECSAVTKKSLAVSKRCVGANGTIIARTSPASAAFSNAVPASVQDFANLNRFAACTKRSAASSFVADDPKIDLKRPPRVDSFFSASDIKA